MSVTVSSTLAGPSTARYSNVYGALSGLGIVRSYGASDIHGTDMITSLVQSLDAALMVPSEANCWLYSYGGSLCGVDGTVGAIESCSLVENRVANTALADAVAGSPGTWPTAWTNINAYGLTCSIAAVGTGYVDVRVQGTVSGSGTPTLLRQSNYTQFAIGLNKVASASCNLELLSGSLGTGALRLRLAERTGSTFNAGASSLYTTAGRYTVTSKVANASTTAVSLEVVYVPTAAEVIDFTLRISEPQLERGIPRTFVPTTDSAIVDPRPYYIWWQATTGYKPFLRKDYGYGAFTSQTGETWTTTRTVIADAAGIRRDANGLYLRRQEGIDGNYISTPHAVANQITGDLTLVARVRPVDFAQNNAIIDKGVAGDLAYQLYTNLSGSPVLRVSYDGTAYETITSSGASLTAGELIYLRARRTASSGAVVFETSPDGSTWSQHGTTQASTPGSLFASTDMVTLGLGSISSTGKLSLYYAAGYANDTGTGTPAFEFHPTRDAQAICYGNYWLEFDGTNDRLETDIAPGSATSGYICTGWAQTEAIADTNALFGSTNSATVHGMRLNVGIDGSVKLFRADGAVSATASVLGAITQNVPFVAGAIFDDSETTVTLNSESVLQTTDRAWTGTSQIALVGASNNVESGISATVFANGAMFGMVYAPSIPTAEQRAVFHTYMKQLAGVTA